MQNKKKRGGRGRGNKAARPAIDDTEEVQAQPQVAKTATKTITSTLAATQLGNIVLPPKPQREACTRRVKNHTQRHLHNNKRNNICGCAEKRRYPPNNKNVVR
ncbi:hypothetical protein ACJJTC_013796 [Scirpophaga incertulas]